MPKQDEIGQERGKKILVPNFVHNRPREENFEKNSKKIEKIKKPHFGIIFSQNGNEIGQEREKKNLSPEFRSYSTRARKFRKKIPKN